MALSENDVIDGYRFLGGDPNNRDSWEQEGIKPGTEVDGYVFKGGNPNAKESWSLKGEEAKPSSTLENAKSIIGNLAGTVGSLIPGATSKKSVMDGYAPEGAKDAETRGAIGENAGPLRQDYVDRLKSELRTNPAAADALAKKDTPVGLIARGVKDQTVRRSSGDTLPRGRDDVLADVEQGALPPAVPSNFDELISSVFPTGELPEDDRSFREQVLDKRTAKEGRDKRNQFVEDLRQRDEIDDAGALARYGYSAAAGAGNALGSGISYLGMKAGSDKITEIGNRIQDVARARTPENQSLSEEVAGGFGSVFASILSAAPAMLMAESAPVAAGIAAIAGWAPRLAKGLQVIKGTAPSVFAGAFEAAGNATETYDRVLQKTGDKSLAQQQADKTFLSNLPLNAALDKFGLFGDSGTVAKKIIMSGGMEGLQEGSQKAISNYFSADPTGQGVTHDALIGALTGAGAKAVMAPFEKVPGPSPDQSALLTTPDSGSFSAMNEFADLVGQERADIQQRRRGLIYTDPAEVVAPIMAAPDIDSAIQASQFAIDDEFESMLKDEQIDIAYRRDEARKASDFDRAIRQADENTEQPAYLAPPVISNLTPLQADALTRVQGFDDQVPTAMQIAMQRAAEKQTKKEASGGDQLERQDAVVAPQGTETRRDELRGGGPVQQDTLPGGAGGRTSLAQDTAPGGEPALPIRAAGPAASVTPALSASGKYRDGGAWTVEYSTEPRTDGTVGLVRAITDSDGRREEHLGEDGSWKKGRPARTAVFRPGGEGTGPETFVRVEDAMSVARDDAQGMGGSIAYEPTSAQTVTPTPLTGETNVPTNEPSPAPALPERGAVLDDARQDVSQRADTAPAIPDAVTLDQGADRGAVGGTTPKVAAQPSQSPAPPSGTEEGRVAAATHKPLTLNSSPHGNIQVVGTAETVAAYKPELQAAMPGLSILTTKGGTTLILSKKADPAAMKEAVDSINAKISASVKARETPFPVPETMGEKIPPKSPDAAELPPVPAPEPKTIAEASPADPVAAVKATLDAAGITGRERTATIAEVRRGDLTPEDVAEAHPKAASDKPVATKEQTGKFKDALDAEHENGVSTGNAAVVRGKQELEEAHGIPLTDAQVDELNAAYQAGVAVSDEIEGKGTPASLPSEAAKESGGRVTSKSVSQSRLENLDPTPDEAATVQSSVEGRSALEAARFIAESAPDADYRMIGARIAERISELEAAGVKFTFNVAHTGDQVDSRLVGVRGFSATKFDSNVTEIWVQGADMTGQVGTSYETVLHELIHAVTQSAVHLGLQENPESSLGNATMRLYMVGDAIIRHGQAKLEAYRKGTGTLTDFEKMMHGVRGVNNSIHTVDEMIAWGMTNRQFQKYLEGIQYAGDQNMWTRFVNAVREFLGLQPKAETALSEILYIGEKMLNEPVHQLLDSASRAGIRLAYNTPRTELYSATVDQTKETDKGVALESRNRGLLNTDAATGSGYLVTINRGLSLESRAKQSDEETLIIQHNLSAENLLHAFKMGGIPVPSLAVTNKDSGFSSFGDITLLGSRDMADPKGYASTKVFGADIYSPRYPRITYAFTANMTKHAEGMLKQALDATNSRIDWSEVSSSGPRELESSPAIRWQFLKDRGIEPQIVRVEVKPIFPALMPFVDEGRDPFDLERDPAFIEVAFAAHEAELVKAYDGDVQLAKDEIADLKKKAEDRGISYLARESARQVNQYRMDLASNGTIDRVATNRALEAQIYDAELRNELEVYSAEFLQSINPDEKIFQGYTNSGNRRYTPHTLENVVKILKKEIRGGENFNYGVGNIRAMLTPQFKSIKQIREAKGRLLDKAGFDAVKKEVDKEFFALSSQLAPYHPVGGELRFTDSMTSMMYDAAKMGVSRSLKENGFSGVPAEDQQDIAEYLNKLRALPTEYFEAKILRDVDLAEFSGAVVPEGVNPKVIEALNARGITDIRYYKKGDDGARAKAVEALADELHAAGKGVLFSKQSATLTNETPDSIRAGLARSLGKSVVDRLEQKGLLRILDTADSLPDGLTISSMGTALYDGQTAYLIADRTKPGEAIRAALHEIGEHHGLETMLGEKGYKALGNRVRLMKKAGNARVKEAFAFVRSAYPELREDSSVFMKEVLANIGQDADVRAKPWWKEMIATVRRWLVQLGYGGLIRTSDIEDMVVHSLRVAAREDQFAGDGNMIESPMYSFAGPMAATADEHALASAQQRLDAGDDAEEVRRETGWHKAADGKWRFEINDADATLKKDAIGRMTTDIFLRKQKTSRSLALGSVLDHPKLFAAYPFMKSYRVMMDLDGSQGGSFEGDAEGWGRITLNAKGDHLSTLLHEIQHSIQTREGFASGGNVNDEIRSAHELLGGASPERGKSLAQYAFNRYRRLAGEVEARNTQARARMTDAERAATSPESTADVPASGVIVVFNGKEMASAPTPENAKVGSGETAFIPPQVEADVIKAAQKVQDESNKFDMAEEVRSIEEGGGVDLSSVNTPEFWNAEDEEYTPAGLAEVTRLIEAQARDNLRLLEITELSDLDRAYPRAQYVAMKSLLDGMGIDYTDGGGSPTSHYLNVGPLKLRFSNHENTARDVMQRDPEAEQLINVAPNQYKFKEALDAVLSRAESRPPAFKAVDTESAEDGATNPSILESRQGATKQAKETVMRLAGRPMLDPGDPFAAENARLREHDQSLWANAKKQLRRYLAPGGLLPQPVFDEKIKRDSEFQAVEFDVRHLVGGLDRAIKADFGMPLDKLSKDQMRQVSDALAGDVLSSLPEATKTAAVAMRQYIDTMSSEYLKIIQERIDAKMLKALETDRDADKAQAINEIELYEKIKGNVGRYVHRSYQAFDDPKWFEKVPAGVLNMARAYLKQGYVEAGETDAKAAKLTEVTLHEILKNGTAYDSMEAFITESKLGAKDLSVLMRRKEVPSQIRALLGEYQDARLNFTKSATKMGRLIWNTRFLDRVRNIGMDAFFFEGKDRPPGATTQIAADGSEVYAPLNGLWTFPETAQAFKDALGKEQMSDLYRVIVRANGLVKYGKTVLSPTTAMRNWQSAMFFSLANGHFDLTQMKKSVTAFREQVSQTASDVDLKYLRHLKQLGVVYDVPYAGEMARLMDDARMEELLSTDKGDAVRWFRKANQIAQGFYTFGDDFWKIIGFENEKAGLMKAGLSLQEAEAEAAKRIRDTYPTYSMVGKGVQWLSRFPLAGTFVSFPSEIIRTSSNMLRTVASDLKSDNPKLRELGMRRAAGMVLVSSAFWALAALSMAMVGVDDDEEEAIRDLAPKWQKNSTFLYVGRDEKGNLRYFDMSFLDPYGYWKRPITAMLRNQPWEDSLASGLRGMLEPFLGADITAKAIFEAVANQKESGGKVYKDKDGAIDQTVDIADHLRKTLQPGFVGNVERLTKAAAGVRKSTGQPYSVNDELVALVGWRATTMDPKTALYYRSFDFTDAMVEARKALTDTLRDSNSVSSEDIKDARQRAKAKQAQAFSEMHRLVGAAKAAGMTRMQITQTLKMANISQANIGALMRGATPDVRVTPEAAQRAIRQARTMRGNEYANEVAQRYRQAAADR